GAQDMLMLRFMPNGQWHDDLVLELNGTPWPCDSYYFLIDDNLPGPEDEVKVRRGLVRLLEQWIEFVNSADPSKTIYLPYDFSDQCIGCLQCKIGSDKAAVARGWSVTGYSVWPSDISSFVESVQDYDVAEPNVIMPRRELV